MDAISRDARFWDRVARKYAKHPIKDLAGYERTIARTRELLGKDDSVLEIGCGTGTSALLLAPAVHRILATDVSGEMIAIAREKVAAQAITNVELAVAAATEPPAAGGPFDAVLAFNVLHLVTDCPATLQHVHRLLKPGGLFISKTPCLSEMNVLIRMSRPGDAAHWQGPVRRHFSRTRAGGADRACRLRDPGARAARIASQGPARLPGRPKDRSAAIGCRSRRTRCTRRPIVLNGAVLTGAGSNVGLRSQCLRGRVGLGIPTEIRNHAHHRRATPCL